MPVTLSELEEKFTVSFHLLAYVNTHTHVLPLKVSVTRHYILQSLSVDLVFASHYYLFMEYCGCR